MACEPIAEGALVISEVRPEQGIVQSDEENGRPLVDLRGTWVELYNASASPIALQFTTLSLTRLDNGDVRSDFVRDPSATIAPGAYFVIGIANDAGEAPPDADYTFPTDVDGGIPDGALIELLDCDRNVVDQVFMRGAPRIGTLNLDGDAPPSAATNDEPDAAGWCDNVMRSGVPDSNVDEMIGTPGAANLVCP